MPPAASHGAEVPLRMVLHSGSQVAPAAGKVPAEVGSEVAEGPVNRIAIGRIREDAAGGLLRRAGLILVRRPGDLRRYRRPGRAIA